MRINWQRVLNHVLFWVVIYVFYVFTYGFYNDSFYSEMLSNLYLLPVRMAFTYLFIYCIMPLYTDKKNYIAFAIATAVHALVFGFAIWATMYMYFVGHEGPYWEVYPFLYFSKIFNSIATNYAIPTIAALIVVMKKWYVDESQKRQLESEKLESELKFLKSQIHPHFLFNTLNNLYALTLKKSPQAPDVVIKLSEMLDYMLYKSNEKEAKLTDELVLIKNYVELEKIRYGERLTHKLEITGNAEGKCIAPLILLPFVENSFKHGASKKVDEPFIDINIEIGDQCLELRVENSFDPNELCNDSYCEGIGLKNVKRRLELLYPGKHILNINNADGMFRVLLTLCWEKS